MAIFKKSGEQNEGMIARIGKYLKGVRAEVKRVTWPTKEELRAATFVVAFMVAMVSLYMWVVDRLLVWIFTFLRGRVS